MGVNTTTGKINIINTKFTNKIKKQTFPLPKQFQNIITKLQIVETWAKSISKAQNLHIKIKIKSTTLSEQL